MFSLANSCGDSKHILHVVLHKGRVVGNIYRVLESALREQMDGFIKCPACNGGSMTPNATDLLSKNCHSLNGRPCWFCEGRVLQFQKGSAMDRNGAYSLIGQLAHANPKKLLDELHARKLACVVLAGPSASNNLAFACHWHGVLPLTGLRGFVVVRTASYSQTHNRPPTRTDGFSSIVSFSKSCIHKIHDCTSIKFRPCLGAKWYLFSTSELPSWLADARHGVVQQAVYADETESQEEVLFGHLKLFRAFHSAVLLISLLASASSSQSADALVSSYNHSPGTERIENADNGFNQSDAVFQFGKELGSCRKPCRRTRKRRNRLREKAVEEAEVRARSILMGLVLREPESYH